MADRGIRTTVQMEGLDEMRRNLQELPKNIQERVLPNAVASGAVLMRNAARAIALVLRVPDKRRTPGLLRRMIRSTRGIRRATEASAFVSVRRLSSRAISKFKSATGKSSSENPNDPFYWSILEFGKSDRTAHPSLRPAFNQEKENAANKIKDNLGRGIEREAEKLRKYRAR